MSNAPKPASGIDSQENRNYIQKQRLWVIGEVLSAGLMTAKPKDPVAACIDLLEKELDKRTEAVDPPSQEVVNEAKAYMTELRIAFLFEDWLKAVLEARPEKPIDFSLEFFKKVQAGNKAAKESASAAAATAGTVIIAFDGAIPATAFAAKAASVGVVEMGYTAVVKDVADIAAGDLVGACAFIFVVDATRAAADAGIIAKIGPATAQLPGAVIVTGDDVNEERVETLTAIFTRTVQADKSASVSGSAAAPCRGRVLLLVEIDEGAASAANLFGRTLVDSLPK